MDISKSYQWLLTRETSWWSLLEGVVITGLFLMCGFLFHLGDPYFNFNQFIWIWLAPILVGLMYGLGLCVLSVLGVIITLLCVNPTQLFASSYGWYALGGVFVSLLCGEFRSVWSDRIERMEQMNFYVQQRLSSMTRLFYVTRISHDQLEQNLISKPMTIRSALSDLRKLLALFEGEWSEAIANRFLSIVAQYCNFDKAAIYPAYKNRVNRKPLANLSNQGPLVIEDRLIQAVLDNQQLAYFAINQLPEEIDSLYLMVAPLCNSEGQLVGLIAVEEMPFLALNKENLQALSVLTSYFSDEIVAAQKAKDFLKKFPACPPFFAAEMYRLSFLQAKHQFDSVLMAVVVKKESKYEAIMPGLQKMSRGLDLLWHLVIDNKEVLFTLMPLTNMSGAEGYVARIKNWLDVDFQLNIKKEAIAIHYSSLYFSDPIQQMSTMLERIEHDKI